MDAVRTDQRRTREDLKGLMAINRNGTVSGDLSRHFAAVWDGRFAAVWGTYLEPPAGLKRTRR